MAETYPHRGETYKERYIETYSDGAARDPYRLKGTFVTGMERRLGNNMWRNFRGEGRGKPHLSLCPSLHTFCASTVHRDAALEVEERDNECGESSGELKAPKAKLARLSARSLYSQLVSHQPPPSPPKAHKTIRMHNINNNNTYRSQKSEKVRSLFHIFTAEPAALPPNSTWEDVVKDGVSSRASLRPPPPPK